MSDSMNGRNSDAKGEVIVGIDLGTTNSEVAAFVDGQVRVLSVGRQRDSAFGGGHFSFRRTAGGRGGAQPTGALSRADGAQHQAQDGQQ